MDKSLAEYKENILNLAKYNSEIEELKEKIAYCERAILSFENNYRENPKTNNFKPANTEFNYKMAGNGSNTIASKITRMDKVLDLIENSTSSLTLKEIVRGVMKYDNLDYTKQTFAKIEKSYSAMLKMEIDKPNPRLKRNKNTNDIWEYNIME